MPYSLPSDSRAVTTSVKKSIRLPDVIGSLRDVKGQEVNALKILMKTVDDDEDYGMVDPSVHFFCRRVTVCAMWRETAATHECLDMLPVKGSGCRGRV